MKKKLLFVIPSLNGGGAENALIKLLKALDYNKYSVSLLLILYQGVYIKDVPREVEVLHLFKNRNLVRVLEYLQKKIGWAKPFKIKLNKVINKNYHTAISFLDGNITDLLFYLESNTKKIAFVHSSYVSNENFNKFYRNKKYLEKVKSQRYAKLDMIVFVSHDALSEFKQVMGEYPNMKVLYNIFNEKEILEKASQPQPLIDKSFFNFIAVGSLYQVKGYDLLINASFIAAKSNRKFKVHILGQGPEEEKLRKQVSKLDLDDVVIFNGYQNNPFGFIESGDVFVMTSVSEALPSVLCEAIIIGKPVLITNTAGCREIINHGEFGMMTERNPESFAEAMLEVINNKKLLSKYEKLSKKRKSIFNRSKILKQLDNFID